MTYQPNVINVSNTLFKWMKVFATELWSKSWSWRLARVNFLDSNCYSFLKNWSRQEKNRDSRVSVILFSIVNMLYNHIRRQGCYSLGALRLPSPSPKKLKDSGAPVLFVQTRDVDEIKSNKMVNLTLFSKNYTSLFTILLSLDCF